MGEYAIARAPGELSALGLGSCVGVCLYDPVEKLGCLAHVMLPDSRVAKDDTNPVKFADTAIPFLLREMARQGAEIGRLEVKIVGGAQMFGSMGGHNGKEPIGARNVAAVLNALSAAGLKPVASSVGGNAGKSIILDLERGELRLRTLQLDASVL